MKLRKALKRHDDITAECPVEGNCQGVQITQGKVMSFSCGCYAGTHEDERGLFVRCDYPRISYIH